MPTVTPVPPSSDTLNSSESIAVEALFGNSIETESAESAEIPSPEEDSTHYRDWANTESDSAAESIPTPASMAKPGKSQVKGYWQPFVVAGVGLGLVFFCSTLYLLSRPCTIGKCLSIPAAQKLNQKSLKTLAKPESGKAVLEAQAELENAIALLEPIPPWSGHYTQAQDLLKTYQAQSETVEEAVNALKIAARAGYNSQNPPHSESEWVAIASLWREAIAQLEEVPRDSKLHPLAKQKIKTYKANLAQTERRLLAERQAKSTLVSVKQAAQMAAVRQGIAQSLSDWQLVYSTWQTATLRIKQIPQGTTAYNEAQQLFSLYVPHITNARNRKTEEQFSANAYNRGVNLAQLATDSQSDNQWSVALVHWRNALTYVKQVPRNTYYYRKAQALIKPYQGALNQAQVQLFLGVKVQQARKDLTQTCGAKNPICTFAISNKIIKIRLAPAYVKTMQKKGFEAQSKGDIRTHSSIVNQISTLEKSLEAIGNNAGIRVEIYSPEGLLIKSHNPRR